MVYIGVCYFLQDTIKGLRYGWVYFETVLTVCGQ